MSVGASFLNRPTRHGAQQPGAASKPGTAQTAGKQDATDWKLLAVLAVMYAALTVATIQHYGDVPPPLPEGADPALFSEGRVMRHLRVLVDDIGHRQVGTPGEELAAQYLLGEAQKVAGEAAAARPDLAVTAVRESATGGVTMTAFSFNFTNAYRNLTNVVLRVAPADPVAAGKPALLINGHYDSGMGTKGASDCGSCVAIALELARVVVANPAVRIHAPVVFLFNGGEETLSQAANGFVSTSSFSAQLGAFINLESTGPWGPDLLFQQTGDWPLQAYARSAPRPRGNILAQDFFDTGLIVGDTDFRMFSHRHYGSLPGIDVAFIHGGTAYHTLRDEVDRIRAGTLQGMGENVLAALQEFTRVLATEPLTVRGAGGGNVFFDLWGRKMFVYTHAQARVLHHSPAILLLLLPLLGAPGGGPAHRLTYGSLLGNTLLALASLFCCLAAPAAVGAARAIAAGAPLAWYSCHALGYAMYMPAAAAGLLFPYLIWPARRGVGDATPLDRALGVGLCFALLCTLLTYIGMHSSFFMSLWAAATAVSAALLGGGSNGGRGGGWGGALTLAACCAVPVVVVLPEALTGLPHLMDKIGLGGAGQGLFGLTIADAAIGGVAGACVLSALGTLPPHLAAALGRRRGRALLAGLMVVSVAAAGYASLRYRVPYTRDHPKRLLIQHLHVQGADGAVQSSKLSFAGTDSFPLAPALPRAFLDLPPAEFDLTDFEAIHPLDFLLAFGESRAGPGPEADRPAPALRLLSRSAVPGGDADHLELELDTGKPGALCVLNVTGPVLQWSFADTLPVSKGTNGDTTFHSLRLSGNVYVQKHAFWVRVPAGRQLSVELFVKHLEESPAVAALVADLPDWVSPAAMVCHRSRWQF